MIKTLETVIGRPIARTNVGVQAGDAFTVDLTLPDSSAGNVSLRYWRSLQTSGADVLTHSVRVAGNAQGRYTLSLPSGITRYLDGGYLWALWWEPDTGNDVCLMPASGLFLYVSGGFAPADPILVTETELEAAISPLATKAELAAAREAVGDSWSDWLTSDQSAVAGDYLDILLPDKTNDYCFELQLDLKTATGCGWYTRYRLVKAGTPANQASAVIGSYSETIYMQANYSVVDVGSLSYLRMTLTGGSGVITHKVIRSRYRRI